MPIKRNASRNKYHNRKTEIMGLSFDSKKEAERYLELYLLQQAGHISDLKCQEPFELLATFRRAGKAVRGIKYIADFVYVENGVQIAEDVKSKGTITDAFTIKWKFAQWLFPDVTFRIYQ